MFELNFNKKCWISKITLWSKFFRLEFSGFQTVTGKIFLFQNIKIFLFRTVKIFLSKLSKFSYPNCQNFLFQTVKISFSNCQNFLFQTVKFFLFQTVKLFLLKLSIFFISNCQIFPFQTVKKLVDVLGNSNFGLMCRGWKSLRNTGLAIFSTTGGQSRGNPIVGTIDKMFTALTFTIQRWIQF
jgi:hypothetical protein